MSSASTTPKSDGSHSGGYSPREIRTMISIRQEKLEQIAMALKEDPKRISETIDRRRTNERIRLKLCAYWNMPYEKLWGETSDGSEAAAA